MHANCWMRAILATQVPLRYIVLCVLVDTNDELIKLCMGKKSKQSMSGELFINQLIDIVQTYPSYLVVSLRSTSFVGIWFAYIHFL